LPDALGCRARSPRLQLYLAHLTDRQANEHYHRHIEIMPKLGEVAGLEWGTGSYI